FPDLALPFAANLREVVGEDESCSAAIRPMKYHNWLIGKFNFWICTRNGFVVPLGNLAQENACQSLGRELQFCAYTRNVVSGNYGSQHGRDIDRKSTRLNSSHVKISYAVFCLKKKKDYSMI